MTEHNVDLLTELLAERSRYESWLSQLEARKSHAPDRVLLRVRDDYVARLEGVNTQLRGRATDLDASVQSLRSRLQGLIRQEDERRDERTEMELRAAVGEFTPEHAAQVTAACDEALSDLAAQRQTVSSELERLEHVLRQIAPPPAPVAEVAPPAPALEMMSAPASPPQAVQPPAADALDELAFLRSVIASPVDSPAVNVAPEAPSMQRTDALNDLLQPPTLAIPRRQVTPLSSSIPVSRTAAGNPTPSAMPAFFKDVPAEQVKTLKCAECGTMNAPTEWYCERCGGELAAM